MTLDNIISFSAGVWVFCLGSVFELQLPVCQFMLINNAICVDFSILFGTRLYNQLSASSGCG